MSEHWRGDPDEQTAMSKFFYERWAYGSVCVLDFDRAVCSYDLKRGLLIEEKHVSAEDRTWRITQQLAMDRGWWSALFVYETDTGGPVGSITNIDATFCSPSGELSEVRHMDFESFDEWVCSVIGALPRETAA